MALKTTRSMPPGEGIAAGNTATFRLPIGLTYHKVFLVIGNVVAGPGPVLAEIDAVRVILNGRRLINYVTGAGETGGERLDAMNTFDGMNAVVAAGAEGVITIDFDRFNLRTRAAEEVTRIGTGVPNDPTPVTTLTIEVDLGAAAINPTILAFALQSSPSTLGIMKKILAFTFGPTAAGDFEVSDLPKGDIINKIFWHFSANAISDLRVERDNFVVFQRSNNLNNVEQNNGVRVSAAGIFVYDPTEAGNGAEGLVTAGVADLRFIHTVTGAMTLLGSVEYIGGILT